MDVDRRLENFLSTVVKRCHEKPELTIGYASGVTTYKEFFERYLMKNIPCIIKSQLVKDWRSSCDWVDSEGKPNFKFIVSNFGSATAPVADCSVKYYDSQLKNDMKVSEFCDYWQSRISAGEGSPGEQCLYLKDWHFVRHFPDYKAYETPVFFRSDWLNEFWDERTDVEDDYRFVYMGPKGSWTPFHADVYRSYSWSANVCGRKRWHLFPPGNEERLRDTSGKLPYDVALADCPDVGGFENFCITVVQEPGEIIFVPSGWHHQVHNLEDTISINHNWFNGCNVNIVWQSLLKALGDVQKEISEFEGTDGWHEQCQVILKAHHGLNISEFCWMLETIAKKRLEMLGDAAQDDSDPCKTKSHIVFDLTQVLQCFHEILRCPPEILDVVQVHRDIISDILCELDSLV